MIKKLIPLLLVFALALTACGGGKTVTKTPEELTRAYTDAIQNARDQEYNDAFPVYSDLNDETTQLICSTMGFDPSDVTAAALGVSLMNVKAYAVAAVMPASGKEETVKKAFEGFVAAQQQSFQLYLEDQYEIAKAARVETLSDGTVLLVMCENQDAVLESIKASLSK